MNRRKPFESMYFILPLLGAVFCLWYVSSASCDVVYSDYIRLINEYLPDVTDLEKLFTMDVFTRIPASFLQRLINVELFDFSVTFDRLCGIAGLVICAFVLAVFSYRKKLGFLWYSFIMIILFSLNKWEILLNGTAWAHLVSFGLFFIYYYIFDRSFFGDENAFYKYSLIFLPFVILMFAGEYIAAFTAVMILMLGYAIYRRFKEDSSYMGMFSWRVYLVCFITLMTAFMIYFVSRSFAVWEHAGATELSAIEVIRGNPLFIPRFFIKTFAGAVIGQETIASFAGGNALSDNTVLAIGLFVIIIYLAAIVIFFIGKMYKKTLFPMMLLLSGGLNHVMVTISRWIFLKESYALSSRYSGQFMIGFIGIVIIFAIFTKKSDTGYTYRKRNNLKIVLPLLMSLFIVSGNLYTSYQEVKKAPYREANYEKMSEMIVHYEDFTEEELLKNLEWHKSPEMLYNAIKILKENKLNVFREDK
ncbi:MAG: hypothetical protein Q4B86_01190 [Eubacteriales bacterium]|nr:hypothetical protein [Eubacteriales bacterium]